MNIAVLTIGDELLNGDLADTNTAAIARQLDEHSFTVRKAETVGDYEPDIAEALQRLAASSDIVIVTGGLGPTDDDRTARAAAQAFERPLVINDLALRQIHEHFRAGKRPMHPRNDKQALMPNRAKVIANLSGTAPGFHLTVEKSALFFMPGVPSEMLAMLENYVLVELQARNPNPQLRVQRRLNVFGLPEPEVESRINQQGLPENVTLAFAVEFPFVQVKLRATGEDATSQVDRAELAVHQALGDNIFSTGTETMAGIVARLLTITELTVALAESCTGGLIAKLLTDQAGSSAFLERSVVTYANTAKTDCLGVSPELLERYGAVSNECAMAMTKGLHQAARTGISLAVTGIAGPDGGTLDKPVGTVYLSMQSELGSRTERFLFPGNRAQIRIRTAFTALDWLRRLAMKQLVMDNWGSGQP